MKSLNRILASVYIPRSDLAARAIFRGNPMYGIVTENTLFDAYETDRDPRQVLFS